jgi:hypothetical protein
MEDVRMSSAKHLRKISKKYLKQKTPRNINSYEYPQYVDVMHESNSLM